MSFYDDMQNVASELLSEFDQNGKGGIYYVRSVPGAGPADDPGQPVRTPYKLDAVARGVKFKYVDNSEILASDMQLTMAVRSDVTPDALGFITMDSEPAQYKIVRIDPIPAAGTPAAYRIFFRK